ncbi:MAG: hypothetical protein WCR63_02805 [Bacilli bacterium]
MARYVEIKTNTQFGTSAISSKVICDIAYGVLDDLPEVCLCEHPTESEKKKCKVCVIKPLLCRTTDQGSVLYIHVHIRSNENASKLSNDIQREISEQIQSMLELKKFNVQVKIDGII